MKTFEIECSLDVSDTITVEAEDLETAIKDASFEFIANLSCSDVISYGHEIEDCEIIDDEN